MRLHVQRGKYLFIKINDRYVELALLRHYFLQGVTSVYSFYSL